MFTAFFKLLSGLVSALIEFVAENWRWVLPLVAAVLLWFYVTGLQDERDAAIKALADHIQQVKSAAEQRKADNAAKETAAKAALDAQAAVHEIEIDNIRRDYEARNGTDKKYLNDRIDAWRERLQLELKRQAAAGLPEVFQPSGASAEGGGDCDAAAARQAYETLYTACQVTTSDYNSLWKSWDKACAVFGCGGPADGR